MKALVIGSTGGIGSAVVAELQRLGYEVDTPTRGEWGYDFDEDIAYEYFINCSGALYDGLFEDYCYESIDDGEIYPNLFKPISYTSRILRTNPKCKIIHIGSRSAYLPKPGRAVYAASKAGLQMFCKCLALEGIDIHCINPAGVQTKMREELYGKEDPDTLLQPSEVAQVVLDCINGKYSSVVINVSKAEGVTEE